MSETAESYGVSITVATMSDVGRIRTNNEDSCGYAWLEDGSLFVIVADGMGGHEAGEVASGLAVQVVEEAVSRDPEGDPRERLYTALIEANQVILEEGEQSGTRGMGTTSIVAVLRGSDAFVGLVGDSRLYHFRRGHLMWRTTDHTRVQMLLDQGQITEEEARTHPEAGMLTRALGHARMADGRPLEPDIMQQPVKLQLGDTVVMSSDGMHDLIEDWEIGQVIAGKDNQSAGQALIDLACERGGHDNVTIAVINIGQQRAANYDESFHPPPWRPAQGGLAEDPSTFDEPTGETNEVGRGQTADEMADELGFGPQKMNTAAGGAIAVGAAGAPAPGRRQLQKAAVESEVPVKSAGKTRLVLIGCGVLLVVGLVLGGVGAAVAVALTMM